LDITKGGGGFGEVAAGPRKKMLVMPGIDAFFDPEPRLMLMKEMGIDRTVLWPTLAAALEERLAGDPKGATVVVHALNTWIHEHWGFAREDSIYATPIITLALGAERAIEELEFVKERGAKLFLIRVAPVPTHEGRKSFALPEFDPFWARVQELDVVVGMHAGDSGYHRYTNEWLGLGDRERRIGTSQPHGNAPAFLALASEKDALIDAMASIIGHGLATRFPRLRFMPVEYPSRWVRPFYVKLQRTYEQSPVLFDEDPTTVFRRNVWIHAFHEPHPEHLIELGIPVDHVMFGSDFPHPEGMADPLAYADVVAPLTLEQQRLIMGGSAEKLLRVGAYAA
jgi:predicted TIM-barrel fold metal-dependent hydrolase